LLHLVDIAPADENVEPAVEFQAIEAELGKFSDELASKPRWLVINKIDLLQPKVLAEARAALLDATGWQGPVFEISAATGKGTEMLAQAVMRELERMKAEAGTDGPAGSPGAEQRDTPN